jgi:hypothetical protein
MRVIWMTGLAVMLGMCLGSAPTQADEAPSKEEPKKEEPKKEEPKKAEYASLPWTDDEIKKGVKKGLAMLFKLEQTIGEKSITQYTKMEITAVTEEGYTVKTTNLDADKKEIGVAKEKTEKWSEYMAKMRKMPKESTTITEEKIKVPAGEFECKVYKVVENTSKGDRTTNYYFPKDKAGTLAKTTSEGQGFKVSMTLEEHKAGE